MLNTTTLVMPTIQWQAKKLHTWIFFGHSELLNQNPESRGWVVGKSK
jgi:hypothetical protein